MRYKPITIAAQNADLSDVLVRIKLDADTDIGSICQQNGYDVYFTTSDGSVHLPFSRLEWNVENGAASGQFDVLCDIPVSGVTIRMYYGWNASLDYQSREQTYANYLAVYPCDAIFDGNKIEDVSGNGKHITIPSGMTVSVYASERCGKMLCRTDGKTNLGTSHVSIPYDGDVAMSCVTEYQGPVTNVLPGPGGYYANESTYVRMYRQGDPIDCYMWTGTAFPYLRNGNWIDYVSHNITLSSGTCTLYCHGEKGLLHGTYEQTRTRNDVVTIFPGGVTGYGQVRDVRYRKGPVSEALIRFERDSLHYDVATFGIEVRLNTSHRRHNTIIDFI